MATIDIEDTGPGMSADELEQIFEPFARGGAAGQSGAGTPGAGLGLTIAKMLTDLMGGDMTVSSTPGQGSLFRIRLFLPEVHGSAAITGMRLKASRPRPRGYAGPRRKILVVDNEEPDRELLVQLLQPLGFELRTAASGHDCLDLLAAGLQPDVVLMDLAMPGIDGWEALRRIQRSGDADIAFAIVSANAFDKGLDNDVGIRPEDFILKPVRHTELLEWLERRLKLTWLFEGAPAHAPLLEVIAAPRSLPGLAQRAALLEVVNLGFYRGIMNKLAEIEMHEPATCGFVEEMRVLARSFQFEAMSQQLTTQQEGHASPP